MIEIEPSDARDGAVWETVLDLTEWFAGPWTLIGARMVQLHAQVRGREVPRLSVDADALADVRAIPGATQKLSKALLDHGFEMAEMSRFGHGHRFVKGEVSVDVLAPDGLNAIRRRLTVGKLHTVEVPGGSQALQRTQKHEVRIGRREGVIPLPSLLAAILLKARAVSVDDVPESQRMDLALLLSLVDDVQPLCDELRASERGWLRRRKEVNDAAATCWKFLPGAEAQRGLATLRQLIA